MIVLIANRPGSGSEIGNQLYSELGPGKLDHVDFQNATAEETKESVKCSGGWMRLGSSPRHARVLRMRPASQRALNR